MCVWQCQAARSGEFVTDEALQRFLSQGLPFCVEKLYDADEVLRKWDDSIHLQSYELSYLLIGLHVNALPYDNKHIWDAFTKVLESHSVDPMCARSSPFA